LDLDRRAERQFRHSDGAAHVPPRVTEDRPEQVGGSVQYPRLSGETTRGRDEPGHLDHPDHLVQPDQRIDRGECVERAPRGQFPAVVAPVVEDLLGRVDQQRHGGVLPAGWLTRLHAGTVACPTDNGGTDYPEPRKPQHADRGTMTAPPPGYPGNPWQSPPSGE